MVTSFASSSGKSKREAENQARDIVNKWAAGATAVSWIPGSTFVLGVADYAMVRSVANAFEVTDYHEEAVFATVSTGAVAKGAVELLSFIPIFGWAGKAVIAGGITKAMGEGVIVYMRDRSPLE